MYHLHPKMVVVVRVPGDWEGKSGRLGSCAVFCARGGGPRVSIPDGYTGEGVEDMVVHVCQVKCMFLDVARVGICYVTNCRLGPGKDDEAVCRPLPCFK